MLKHNAAWWMVGPMRAPVILQSRDWSWYTLPETNSSPIKIVVSKSASPFPAVYFQGQTVSFREGSWLRVTFKLFQGNQNVFFQVTTWISQTQVNNTVLVNDAMCWAVGLRALNINRPTPTIRGQWLRHATCRMTGTSFFMVVVLLCAKHLQHFRTPLQCTITPWPRQARCSREKVVLKVWSILSSRRKQVWTFCASYVLLCAELMQAYAGPVT